LYEALPRSLGGRDSTDYYDHTDARARSQGGQSV